MNLGNRFPVPYEGGSMLPSDHWTNLGSREMPAPNADPRFPVTPELPVMRNEGVAYIGDHSEMLGLQGGIPAERRVLQMNCSSPDDVDGESWRDLLIFGSEVAQGTPTEEAIDEFDHEISVKGGYYQNLLKMSSNGNEYMEFQSPNSIQIQASSASQGIATSNFIPMTAIGGTPFQQKDAYNLNSSLGSESGIDSSCVGNRMEFAPETPDHGKQLINHQLSDAQSFSAEESLPGKKDDGVVCTSSQGQNPLNEHSGSLAELPAPNSTLMKEHIVSQEVGHGGIDLNKAPAQSAPRRRKHRPKVLREKTKKTPKPPVERKPKRTPKPKNPDEKAPAKRKYVRKKGIETSVPEAGDEASEVRRGLSFDPEVRSNDESDKRTAAQQQSNARPFDLNLSSQEFDGVQDITAAMERPKSACSSVQQLSPPHSHVSTTVRVHNYDASARSLQTASTADKNGQFHLNQGYQPLNGEGKGKAPVQANVSVDRSSIGGSQTLLVQTSATVLKERSKRNHWQTSEGSIRHPANLMHSQAFHEMRRTVEQDILGFRTGFADPDSNKRKKFDNMPCAASFQDYSRPLEFGGSKMSHKSSSSSSSYTYSGPTNFNLGMQSTLRGSNGLLADRGTFPTTLRNGFKDTRNVTWLQYHRLNMLKNYLEGAEALNLNATTGNETVTSVDLSQKRQMVKPASSIQPNLQKLHLNDHGKQLVCHNSSKKVKEPKRGKSYAAMVDELLTRLENLAISKSDKGQNALVPSRMEINASDKGQNALVPSRMEINASDKGQNALVPSRLKISASDKGQNARVPSRLEHLASSASDKGQNALVPSRLKHLAGSASGEEQNALVPYKGDDRVVPYVDPIKKSKARPRVDLDPETTKLWNLLMGKADSESAEPMDEDKEKWWEGERKLVHGRVEAFIKRMHQFQGDRRFSEWKGSVLDSVIGVFLTQNVSDHLSSSAYISLTAKFPAKQNKPRPTCSEYESISWVEEPDVQIIDPDGTITYHGRKVMQPHKKQSSATLNGSSEERPEILNWGTVTHCANENSSSREEDVISSQNSSESFCQSTKYTRSSPESEVDDHVTAYNSKKDGHFEDTHRTEEYTSLQQFHSQMMTGMLNDKSPMPDYEQPRDPASTGIFPKIFSGRNEHSDPVNPDFCCLRGTSYPSGCFCLNKTTDTGVNGSCCSAFSEHSFSSNSADISKTYDATHASKMNGGSAGSASYSTSAEPEIPNYHVRRMDNLQPGLDFVSSQDSVNSSQVQASSSFHQEGKSPAEPARLEGAAAKETGSSGELLNQTGPGDTPNAKRKRNVNKAKEFDWDSLRRKVISEHGIKERTPENMDTLDYEALRHADVKVISRTILERGMNNMLAERIKDFLNRLVRDHGSTDLEWLREVPPEQAKDYLLSVRGLGLKSVECVRLLTLHQVAFPVDTNVGRIAVRLGWVPLQPLPESLQLHLLELYPILESIQKYLWPRLCKLDQRTLYELHYQLITFGKVFCTKKKPNCNACPMRPECRHFASAFASARLALPAPGEKRIVNSTPPMATRDIPSTVVEPMRLLPACNNTKGSEVQISVGPCEPIVEEPASPEPEPEPASPEVLDSDIEDFYYEDPDEIPTINLNFEEFKTNVENVIRGQNMGIQLGELSKALVALDASTASIPVPKLKNVSRLRTEHLVYELPDSHPLLKEMERREPDDPSPYLLAIWGPEGSTRRPEGCSHNHETENNSETVKGTLLIPCRTATRGSFPLNGTYFQVNEMFADDESSNRPIDVPRDWLWKLPRRTVYFGTSVTSIFRGMSQSGIQYCFWKGFVCVRGFNRQWRTPKPLCKELHEIASKVTKNKDNEDIKEPKKKEPKKKEPKNKGTKETKNKGDKETKNKGDKEPKRKEPKKGNGEENNRLM